MSSYWFFIGAILGIPVGIWLGGLIVKRYLRIDIEGDKEQQ